MLSCFSHVWLFATPWTVACQAPLSMGFSRQEYWSGLSCPSPGDLRDPGIKSVSHISCIGRQVRYHKCHQITCLEGNTPTKKKKVGEKGRKEVVLIRKAVESQGPSVAPSSPEPVHGEALGWQWQGQQYTSCYFCKWNVCNGRVPIILKQWAMSTGRIKTKARIDVWEKTSPHHRIPRIR